MCQVNVLNALCMYIALFSLHKNSDRKQMLREATQLVSGNLDSNSVLLDFKVQAANPCLMSLRGVPDFFSQGCLSLILYHQ